jgi:hypothetical protein
LNVAHVAALVTGRWGAMEVGDAADSASLALLRVQVRKRSSPNRVA